MARQAAKPGTVSLNNGQLAPTFNHGVERVVTACRRHVMRACSE